MEQQKKGGGYVHAAVITALSLATWALLSDGIARFANQASGVFFDDAHAAPGWATEVTRLYLVHPVVTLWYLPAVAALAVCVSLVRRRAKTLTLRTIFIGMTLVCMMLAFMAQAERNFYAGFPIFVIVHTTLSIGLTIWLVRELRMLLEALSKTQRD